MPFVYYLQIHFWLLCGLDVLAVGLPDYGFVNNKQIAFLEILVSHELLFLFLKHLDTMSNLTDCGTGRTDLCQKDIYTTSMEGKKLITKLVNKNNVVISSREFDDKGFVLTYYANEIKATTTFKKAENLI